MATWISSLSWTLISSLAQGLIVYTSLWLVLRTVPARSANVRYHLSLSALTIMLGWFVATWWRQYHLLAPVAGVAVPGATVLWLPVDGLAGTWRSSASLPVIDRVAPWLSAFYVVGLALMLVRLSAGIFQLRTFRRSGTSRPDAALSALLHTQQQRLQHHAAVGLLVSAKAQVPMVVGFFKPVILLPAAVIARLAPDQLETILLHELAHIKRHDHIVTILQAIAETLLFFNPFMWAISAIARREREHSCDDLVVSHTAEPIAYATALATLAASHRAAPRIAVAATGQPAHLYHRIQRIMEVPRTSFSYSRVVATIIIIAGISGAAAWASPSFSKVKKNKATTAKQPVTPTPEDAALPAAAHEDRVGKTVTIPVDRPKKAVVDTTAVKPVVIEPRLASMPEETLLVERLLDARLVDQVKGFLVEKAHDELYINSVKQTPDVARRYLSGLTRENIRVQVFSLEERMRMHPDANFIQLLLPATFSSPCIDTRPAKKEGC